MHDKNRFSHNKVKAFQILKIGEKHKDSRHTGIA